MNPQPDDICQRPDCGRIRNVSRHAPCTFPKCVCGGKRNVLMCHDFVKATK